ncbi:MAG: hypothetical protein KC917_11980, partial [Candidatus Omnitrophica bacterium]|nr:hypothetical protein [Candidatus Omnitrophota bacterium]
MKNRETLLSLIFLTVALSILFAPVLLRGETFALGDVPDQFLPWRIFTAEEISDGRIPLWNPYTFCGSPFLANMQSAVLYPIDRAVDLFFQPEQGVGIGMILHLFLGGFFLFLLARSFGASELPSGIVAIGYALGGFHAIHFLGGNLLTITSSIYLPGHLWVVHSLRKRIEEGRRMGYLPLIGVLLAVLQVLSGHAQMTFYNAFFVGVFFVLNLIQMKSDRSRLIGILSGIALCAALLAAPQILPTLEYSRHASRTGTLPYLPATEFSFGWEFLASFLLPEYLGTRADLYTPLRADTYWGDWKNWSAVYIRLLPALGFLSFFIFHSPSPQGGEGARGRGSEVGRRDSTLTLLLPLLLIALILALGRNTPIYWYVHHYAPLFGKFRAPSKFLPGVIVPFAVIGALGLNSLFFRLSQIRMCHKRAFAWGGVAIFAGGLLFGYSMNSDFLSTPVEKGEVVWREALRFLSMLAMTVGVLLFYVRSQRPKKTEF